MAPRNLLSCKEKIKIINANEREKLSVRKLAKRFKIGKTQAAEILKNKDAIKSQWQSGNNIDGKKNCLSPHGLQVDKLCYEWFLIARAKNIPISGPIIKAKAMEIAQQVEYSGFAASDGWLQKWRTRHNINFKSISGEAYDVSQFRQKLPSILSGNKPEDVFNADEIGLSFRALPDKSLAFKSEKSIDSKMSKKRNIEINIDLDSDSASDEDIILQRVNPIKTYNEALHVIKRFKELASHDFIAYQHLNNLKSRFGYLQLKHQQKKS